MSLFTSDADYAILSLSVYIHLFWKHLDTFGRYQKLCELVHFWCIFLCHLSLLWCICLFLEPFEYHWKVSENLRWLTLNAYCAILSFSLHICLFCKYLDTFERNQKLCELIYSSRLFLCHLIIFLIYLSFLWKHLHKSIKNCVIWFTPDAYSCVILSFLLHISFLGNIWILLKNIRIFASLFSYNTFCAFLYFLSVHPLFSG